MNDKLDVFKLLSENEENQEQYAPDFDLLNVKTLLETDDDEITDHKKSDPVEMCPDNDIRKQGKIGKAIKASVAVLLLLLIAYMTVSSFKVNVGSMEPLIESGDRIVVNKLARAYRTGDIISFKTGNGQKGVARIVAVPGDTVIINNSGELLINNQLQQEKNISDDTNITDKAVSYPVIVDEESYFVLGDNRTDSMDSRNSEIGLVSEKEITGKVVYCFKRIK